ncbi:MAG: hypothetical protein IID31_10435 [Planctomycetes bacterium]|nr:hypothetical protein [Planctomycetota bacterium]
MQIIEQPIETGNPTGNSGPTISLAGLLDLLDVLESEVGELPSPAPLFAHELERALAETLGVAGDGS